MPAVSIQAEVVSGVASGPVGTGPLRTLASDSSSGSIFRYPADLGQSNGNNSKNHWVTFTLYDVQPAGYGVGVDTIQFNKTKAGRAAGILLSGAQGIEAVSNLLQGNVFEATARAVATGVIGLLTKTGLNIKPQLLNLETTISLYMPDTLDQSYSSAYDEMNLTDLGPAITTLRAIDSASSNFTDINIFNSQNSKGNNIGVDKYAILAAQQLGSVAGVNLQNIGDVLLKSQGLAINPQVQMIYRGTSLRSFDLTFIFTPKSQLEAETVNSIINQFRFYSSPSLGNPGDPTNSMFLIPPSQFGIQFFVNGKESNVLPKYGQCVLTSMDVNNSPNGFAVYEDGSMVQTRLTLSFKELDMLTRDYFVGSGVSGDVRR
jgi:hypothetical protein